MWSNYGALEDDYIAVLDYVEHYLADNGQVEGGKYVIAYHKGLMPAFGTSEEFDTLADAKSYAKDYLGIVRWRGLDGRFTATPA